MSMKSITSMLGAVLLSALGSACVVYPQPSSDGNGNVSGMSEPIAYFGDVMLFEDKNQPLAVQVQAAASADNLSLAKAMQDTLYESDVKVVANSDPCDVKIRLQSKYEELTAAPKCRLDHTLTILAETADGELWHPRWNYKTSGQDVYDSRSKAEDALYAQIDKTIRIWAADTFRSEVADKLDVSVLRFRTNRKMIQLNPVRYEKDVRLILNGLRSIDGVIDVRLVEENKENRIASFRVLYRKGTDLKTEIEKMAVYETCWFFKSIII